MSLSRVGCCAVSDRTTDSYRQYIAPPVATHDNLLSGRDWQVSVWFVVLGWPGGMVNHRCSLLMCVWCCRFAENEREREKRGSNRRSGSVGSDFEIFILEVGKPALFNISTT